MRFRKACGKVTSLRAATKSERAEVDKQDYHVCGAVMLLAEVNQDLLQVVEGKCLRVCVCVSVFECVYACECV